MIIPVPTMALFTKLKERVSRTSLKFDNLEHIAKREEEANCDEIIDDRVFVSSRLNKSSVSVFNKDDQLHSYNERGADSTTRKNENFVNIVPSCNDENALPIANSRHISSKNDGYDKTLKLEQGSATDSRFATSRSIRILQATKVVENQSSDDFVEDIHTYSDDDLDEQELSKQDRIELVFSKARHNHIGDVVEAIQKGFDANTKDSYGNTLLHICAQNNRKKLAATLLQQFPQCNARSENFKQLTPLDYAQRYGFQAMATWLREVTEDKEAQTARNVSKVR